MKEAAQGKQPTAASGWLQVTVCHVWAMRGAENEFLSTTGRDPDLSVHFENLVQPECVAFTL